MKLFLAQTDTTAGFLSKSKDIILTAKMNNPNKLLLLETANIKHIKDICRIPKASGNMLRRKNKTTIIFPNNKSFRIIRHDLHGIFIKTFKMLYSSSANMHKGNFDYDFATDRANVIIFDKRGIFEDKPSSIYQLRKNKFRKIR